MTKVRGITQGGVCMAPYKMLFMDCDGVLFDFVRHVARHHKLMDRLASYPRGEYRLEAVLGIPAEQMWAPLGPEFWETIPVYEGGHAFLASVQRLCATAGTQLVFCTKAPMNYSAFTTGRVKAIRTLCNAAGVPVIGQIHICVHGSKGVYGGPGRLLVDDHAVNIEDFEAEGGTGILVPMVYNNGDRGTLDPDYNAIRHDIALALSGGKVWKAN